MPRRPTGRRRGGQPGNHNRLKHGLYARKLPIPQHIRLETLGLNREHLTIALARARLDQLLTAQAAAPASDFLSYERAVQFYIYFITRLIHRNAQLSRDTGIPSSELSDHPDWLEDL